MKRQLNHRPLSILLAVLIGGTAATFLLHGWQARRHARNLMARVQHAESEGRLDQAAQCLQRYLVFAPGDNAALARYGVLVEQAATSVHESWRAVTVYEQVLDREPSRHDIRRRLALLTARLGWHTEARAHLEVLLRDQPGQSDLEHVLGVCQEEAGDCQLAVTSYRNAIRHTPNQVDAYVRLANLLQYRLDQAEKAGRVFDDLVRNNGNALESHLARAVYRMRHGLLADAGRDMDRARELAPDNPRVLLIAADLARRLGQFDAARRYLRHGRELDAHNIAMHLALARLELDRDRKNEAIECLRQGLRAAPDQPDLMDLLAETLIEQGDARAAEKVIQHLRRPGSLPGLAHYLDGRLQQKRKQWPQAIRTFEEVAESRDSATALVVRARLSLAQCHEQLGDGDRRLAALRHAVNRDPSSAPARLALAVTLLAAGMNDEALRQYREVVQLPQAPDESWVPLGLLLVSRNRSLPPRKRRWAEVERVLERAARLPSLEVPLAILRADLLVAQEKPDQARALLERAVAAHPNQVELWTALADLAMRQGQLARSAHILEKARQQLKGSVELYQSEVALCAMREPRQARETLRRLENDLHSLSADEQLRLLGQLAAAHYQLDQNAEGQRLCRMLADRAPADLSARLPLLDLALQGDDEGLLVNLIADVRRLEGEEGTWWRYGEAARLILRMRRGDRGGCERARTLVTEITQRRPNWSRGALLEAYLLECSGESARAVDAYLRAFAHGERRPGVVERLVRLLADRGRLDEADDAIRKLQQQAAPPASLARLGAEIALGLHHSDRALQLARLSMPSDSNDYRKLIWFGQILALAGHHDEAERMLRGAVRLRGDVPETWIALVAHLAKAERMSEAEVITAEMCKRLPADQAALAQAVCAETLGNLDNADQYYRQALAQRLDDGLVLQRAAQFHLRLKRFQQAKPLLRGMIDRDANVPPASQVWARRQLALILAFTSGDKHHEALALLDKNKRSAEDSLLDARARLLVQATRAEERTNSLRLLLESSKTRPFTAEELFYLVRLHEMDNEASKARERMLDLLALDKNNPEYLAYHIDSLLRRGQKDEARPWMARLQKLEPDSSRVQAFRSSLLKRHSASP